MSKHTTLTPGESLPECTPDLEPGDRCTVEMPDDSMEPRIPPGAPLTVEVIDPAGYVTDGIYLFRMGGAAHVKRLQFRPNEVRVLPGERYEAYSIDREEIDLIGIVTAGITRI
jgi:phage repressor protein C with HTH and peptisase S24 domain